MNMRSRLGCSFFIIITLLIFIFCSGCSQPTWDNMSPNQKGEFFVEYSMALSQKDEIKMNNMIKNQLPHIPEIVNSALNNSEICRRNNFDIGIDFNGNMIFISSEMWYFIADSMAKQYGQITGNSDLSRKVLSQSAIDWYTRGTALDMAGRHGESITAFDIAIQLDPGYSQAWNNKGNALDSLGKRDEAMVAYDKAIQLDPKNAVAWYNKGVIYLYQKNFQEANIAFDKAIQLDPGYANAWHNKGIALVALGRNTEADKAFTKSQSLEESNT